MTFTLSAKTLSLTARQVFWIKDNMFGRRYVPGVAQRLQGLVKDDGIWVELMQMDNVRDVDVSPTGVASNCYEPGNTYYIEITLQIPPKLCLILLFPDHEKHKQKVCYTDTYNSVPAINKVIGERMSANPQYAAQIAVVWGDHIYRVTGIKGHLYLHWAVQIQVVNSGETEVGKMESLPFLLVTNKHYGIRAVYPLFPGTDENGKTDTAHFIDRNEIVWGRQPGKSWLSRDTRAPVNMTREIAYRSKKEQEIWRARKVLPPSEREENRKRSNRRARRAAARLNGNGRQPVSSSISLDSGEEGWSSHEDEDNEDEEYEDQNVAAFFGSVASSQSDHSSPPHSGRRNRRNSRADGGSGSSAEGDIGRHMMGTALTDMLDGTDIPPPSRRNGSLDDDVVSVQNNNNNHSAFLKALVTTRERRASDVPISGGSGRERTLCKMQSFRVYSGRGSPNEIVDEYGSRYKRRAPGIRAEETHNSIIPVSVLLDKRRTGSHRIQLIPQGTPYNSADYEEVVSSGSDSEPVEGSPLFTKSVGTTPPRDESNRSSEEPLLFTRSVGTTPPSDESNKSSEEPLLFTGSVGTTPPSDESNKSSEDARSPPPTPKGVNRLDTTQIPPNPEVTPPTTDDEVQ